MSQAVQRRKSTGNTDILVFVIAGNPLQFVVQLKDGAVHLDQSRGVLALANLIQLLLGKLHQTAGIRIALFRVCDDTFCHVDQGAHIVFFLHQLGICFHIGGTGHHLHQLGQIDLGIPVAGEDAVRLCLLEHGDKVDGLGCGKHSQHDGKQLLVLRTVKAVRRQQLQHAADALRLDEDCTQHRLLCLQAEGQLLRAQFDGFFCHAVFPSYRTNPFFRQAAACGNTFPDGFSLLLFANFHTHLGTDAGV